MATVVNLMRQQRRGIFVAIENEKYAPDEFQWEEFQDGSVTAQKLIHLPTRAYFLFTLELQFGADPRPLCEWSPGEGEPVQRANASVWESQRDYVYEWLRNIRQEFYDPDPWDSVSPLTTADANDEAFFSPEERADLSLKLREILDYIAEQRELSADEKREVEVRFVLPLEDAAAKLKRGQWKLMFYGALINEGVHIGFSTPVWAQIAHLAVQTVSHFFGAPLPALPTAI